MNREIKIRGFSCHELTGNTQWLHGFGAFEIYFSEDYAREKGRESDVILFTEDGNYEVHKESVGQYTGLKDKNGTEIYEGDVIEIREVVDYIYEPNKIVTFHKGCFGWRDDETGFIPFCILDSPKKSLEVLGNIHEHSHLLGGVDE